MSNPEFSSGERGQESEQSHGTIEAKELFDMLGDMRGREEEIVALIDDAILEPIPDPSDQEAVDAFNHKMAVIKELIPVYIARSEVLIEMQSRITEKLSQIPSDH